MDRYRWNVGNNKDKDDDNDGVEDRRDVFPDESEHIDTDKDGIEIIMIKTTMVMDT